MRGNTPPTRNPTIDATDLKIKPPAPGPKNCVISKSKRHKLQHCLTVTKCKHVAVHKRYAASCAFCYNYGVERRGHDSTQCNERPACSKCPGRLHTDETQDGRRPNQLNSKEFNDKGDNPPATIHSGSYERVNTSQTASTNSDKPEPTPISSAGLSTTETQVLLNVEPRLSLSLQRMHVW